MRRAVEASHARVGARREPDVASYPTNRGILTRTAGRRDAELMWHRRLEVTLPRLSGVAPLAPRQRR
jgi:hypothetical protein